MIQREEIIGDCRLILGDCLEVMPGLGEFDAVITSPPYGQQRDYGQKIADWRGLVSGALLGVPSHETTQIICNLGMIHKDGSVVRYWDDLFADMEGAGWRLFGWYVWDQGSGMAGHFGGRLAPSHEFVFHFNRNASSVGKTKPTLGGRQHSGDTRNRDGTSVKKSHDGRSVQPFKIPDSVLRCPRETESGVNAAHPARFPVRFAAEYVGCFSSPGQTILDPFMGSGTTGVACVNLGRKFTGIELDPGYFDIACRRIEEAYKQPRLIEHPKPAPAVQERIEFGDGAA
jgi:DNA modification methylase